MPQELRADPPTLDQRKDEIKGLIVKGLTCAQVKAYAKEKHAEDWQYSDKRVYDLYHECLAELSEEAPGIDRRREFAIAKARNDLLFNSAFKLSDFKTALSANVQNIKLMRLDDPKFKMDWKAAAEAAGLDPEETMRQFTELMNAQAAEQDAATHDDENATD